MYVFGIIFLIGVVISIRKAIQGEDGDNIGCLFFIIIFIGIIIGFLVPIETKQVKKVIYLECLQDNSATEGSFFLGSGSVSDVWKYSYYTRRNGAYYLESIDANGTPVRYTTGKPRIEWIEEVRTDAKRNKWSLRSGGCGCNEQKIIYIPKGSIKQNYNLDAN